MNARANFLQRARVVVPAILAAGFALGVGALPWRSTADRRAWGQDRARNRAVTARRRHGNIILTSDGIALTISPKAGDVIRETYLVRGRKLPVVLPGHGMYFDANAGPDHVPPAMRRKAPRAGYAFPMSNARARIIRHKSGAVEVVLTGRRTFWFPFQTWLHIEMRPGISGYYVWAVYHHGRGMPAATMAQTRLVVRVPRSEKLFNYQVVSARRIARDVTSPIVRQVQDTTYLLKNGKIYTKYNNCEFVRKFLAYGMAGHGVGMWMIWPGLDFQNGIPARQDLTLHLTWPRKVYMPKGRPVPNPAHYEDGVILAMFSATHFGAPHERLMANERWTKCYGPVLIYTNKGRGRMGRPTALYRNARRVALQQRGAWPFKWVHDASYPTVRGTVSGIVRTNNGHSAAGAWAILCPPGKRDWAMSSLGYMYFTRVRPDGVFSLKKVRAGAYRLFISGANHFKDFLLPQVRVRAGHVTRVGALTWKSAVGGKTGAKVLWEIGVANRSTREFRHGRNVRHYGNFRWYPREFPHDVDYIIGKSTPRRDWNFAQWSWYCKTPYWTIQFKQKRRLRGTATLTIGFCAADFHGGLQIKVNGRLVKTLFMKKSGMAAYRSGGEDSKYSVRRINFSAALLRKGGNKITLGFTRTAPFSAPFRQRMRVFGAVMYDALRLSVRR